MQRFLSYLLIFFVVACSPHKATLLNPTSEVLSLFSDDITLEVDIPELWTSHISEEHIILMEMSQPIDEHGAINGVIVNIWLPQKADLDPSASATTTTAEELLGRVLDSPDLVASAAVSTPVSFRWHQYDSAYYLLNNGDGNVTLVLALTSAHTDRMIALNLSTNTKNTARLLPTLSMVLEKMHINGTKLDASLVNHLPSELPVPVHNPPEHP